MTPSPRLPAHIAWLHRFPLICAFAVATGAIVAQNSDPATKFGIADVHATPGSTASQFQRVAPALGAGTRFEARGASMLNLIYFAWLGYSQDKIVGGPPWLEMNRYDIEASVPAGTPVETQRIMLQSLLAERFKLVVRKEDRPLGTYALTVNKTNRMKPGDKSGDTGCHVQNQDGGDNAGRIMLGGRGGPITLGAGGTILYICRNMTMDSFATALSGMLGTGPLGSNPLLNKTGLEGVWSFDVKWALGIGPALDGAEHITIFDAFEKQLGLKFEKAEVPTPVLVVESVLETPTPNAPGVAEALPPVAGPTSFEVADIKPSDPAARGGRSSNSNGRYTAENMALTFLLSQAFSEQGTPFAGDSVVNIPDWAANARFDVNAKTAAGGASMVNIGPLLRSLLVERFGLKYHTEERPVAAYTLVATKPKLKKADPSTRAHCVNGNAPAGAPPGAQVLTCQNVTMDQFAEQLRNRGPGLSWPVLNSTGLEGTWDFTLTFGNRPAMAVGRGGEAGAPGDVPQVQDPDGTMTIFDAVEKQLGLKLEPGKRPMTVTVIDHLNQTPTEN